MDPLISGHLHGTRGQSSDFHVYGRKQYHSDCPCEARQPLTLLFPISKRGAKHMIVTPACLPLNSTMGLSMVDEAKQCLCPEPAGHSSLLFWRNQRLGGREASRWGGNSHHCPLVQRSWSLDSKWAVYTQDQEEKSELGHEVVIIRFLKSHHWTETRLVECGSEVEPWPTNVEEQTWFLVIRPVQQWHELSWEVGRPCHEKCSESEDVWQGLCGSALVSRQSEDQFLPTHYY